MSPPGKQTFANYFLLGAGHYLKRRSEMRRAEGNNKHTPLQQQRAQGMQNQNSQTKHPLASDFLGNGLTLEETVRNTKG